MEGKKFQQQVQGIFTYKLNDEGKLAALRGYWEFDEAMKTFRRRRNATRADRAVRKVAEAAESDGNLVGPILDAVKARATVGEISDALRGEFGIYRPREDV